jgi:uncharacterized membrane protein
MIRSFLLRILSAYRVTWIERRFVWILFGAAIVCMGISLAIGLQQSVWFDEAYSIMLAKQPAVQLVHLTALDTHPPFYYLLLKGWASVLGWSELALRSLSVLAGGLAVVFAGLAARKMFGARVALMALPFVVFAPLLLRYGFEVRMYALGSLIGMAATYALVCALQTKSGRDQWLWLMLYGALVALGVYTLYYLVLLWVAHAVWLAWVTRRDKKPLFSAPWIRAYLLSIVLFLPWAPAFISQIGNGALAAISQPLTVDNLVGIVSFNFLYQPTWQLGAIGSIVVVLLIVVLVTIAMRAFKLVDKKQRQYLVLLLLYIAVPVVVIGAVSIIRPMYVERYLAHVALGGMLFVGVAVVLTILKEKRKAFIGVGMIAVLLAGTLHLTSVGNYNFQRLQTPMVKQAAASITGCSDISTVFAADPYVAIELAYYLPDCQIYFYSQTPTLRGGYAPLSDSPLYVSDPQKELVTSKKIYYAYYGAPQLTMPHTAHQVGVKTYGALSVATFSAE